MSTLTAQIQCYNVYTNVWEEEPGIRKKRLTLNVFGGLGALQSLEEQDKHLLDVGHQNCSENTTLCEFTKN